MKPVVVPTIETISANNVQLFGALQNRLGFVPNLYATFALSNNALQTYLQLQSAKTSLKAKEKEIINLVVSQVNECRYCLSAHTMIAKMNDFTDEQILEIRGDSVSFNDKYDALAKLVKSIAENRGHANEETLEAFYSAGYTEENLVDTIVLIGDKIISNYLHANTRVPIDFPIAPSLEEVHA